MMSHDLTNIYWDVVEKRRNIIPCATIVNQHTMDGEILQRVETKLDLIIELLHDKTLTPEEIALLKETDECVRSGRLDTFARL